jgi:hypothetical protein
MLDHADSKGVVAMHFVVTVHIVVASRYENLTPFNHADIVVTRAMSPEVGVEMYVCLSAYDHCRS